MYEIVVRNWWKDNPAYPGRLEPDGWGDPKIIQRDVETESQAQAICQEYNETHDPGKLSRKAEYRDDGRDTEYNGYPNYATWNVMLWIDNERQWYHAKIRLLERLDKPVTADNVRWLVDHIGLPRKNTDLEPADWQHVRWEYLAEHLESERLEMKDEDDPLVGSHDLSIPLDQLKNQRILKEQNDARKN